MVNVNYELVRALIAGNDPTAREVRATWSVTYEIITDESAEDGDAAERGWLGQGLPFREALEVFQAEQSGGMIEESDSVIGAARWFTAYGERDMRDGSYCNVSLHIPEHVTPASRRRLARLLMPWRRIA